MDSTTLGRRWTVSLLAAAVVLAGGFTAASETMVRVLIEPVDPFEKSIQVFQSSRATNAAFGDSIVARGFHGQDEFVNLAFPADTWRMVEIKALAYFSSLRPGKVILAASHTELREDPGTPQYYEYYDDVFARGQKRLLRVSEPRHRDRLIEYWRTLLTKGEFRPTSLIRDDGTMLSTDRREDTAWAMTSIEQRRDMGARFAARQAPPDDANEYGGGAVLAGLMRELARRGADVCVVRFPASPEFRAAAEEIVSYGVALEWFRRNVAEAGGHLVDLWAAFDDPQMFLDPTHLSPRGAEAFGAMATRACFSSAN